MGAHHAARIVVTSKRRIEAISAAIASEPDAGERVVADTALALLGESDAEHIGAVLEQALARACELLDADRGVLFECGTDESYADAVYEWHAPGVYPVKGGRYEESEAPTCFADLRAGEIVTFVHADPAPRCAGLQRVLEDQGSRSAVLTPMHRRSKLVWLLVFEWKRISRPVDNLVFGFCRRLALAMQAGLERADELHAQKEAFAKMVERQKLESLGVMAGGIAHDFNNVLQSVLSVSEVLMLDLPDGQTKEWVESINAVAKRAATLTSKLLVFSRQDVRERRVVAVAEALKETVTLLRRSIPEDRSIELDVAQNVGSVRISPLDLEQVVINLCNNASSAMAKGGEIQVQARCVGDEQVQIVVQDEGVGMSKDTLERACTPFFTTKPPGEGTGLGLAIVKRVVESAGGALDIESTPGRGTRVLLTLPRDGGRPDVDLLTNAVEIRGNETVLLVEDDPMIRRVAATHLERAGFEVLRAADGKEALALYRERSQDIALVFTDAIMPKMGAAALYDAIAAESEPPPFLFGSGYDAGTLSQTAIEAPDHAFLQKPYEARQLLRRVRRLIDERARRPRYRGTD